MMPMSSDGGDTPPTTPGIGNEGVTASTPASGTGTTPPSPITPNTPSSPSSGGAVGRVESILPPAVLDTQSLTGCEEAGMSSRVFNTKHMPTSTLQLQVCSVTMTPDKRSGGGSLLSPRRRKTRQAGLRKMLRHIRRQLDEGEEQ